ncbi:PH domain-containing protein [Lacimicrobium sp. SS2-24]|uniref:PH domain-containing protein n=1 Tax=Lacimicrobium sp. SS2-24 TaxID=2005569 RepID=UPI000B4B7399|nr:PH domain-containing protein [Lacimicrobium sp. SS2-24]
MHSEHFTNRQLTTLPDIDALTFSPLSPWYAKLNLLLNLSLFLFLLLITLVLTWQQWFSLPTLITSNLDNARFFLTLTAAVLPPYWYAADKRKGYALREHDLSYRSGLLFISTVTQPVLRIQHVELKRGPIERRAGLASLQVFSAGGAMHTFAIPGLPLATAKGIRRFILEHKDIVEND